MKKKTKYDIVLFSILGVLAFLPILQEHTHLFKVKPLCGVVAEAEKPHLDLDSYVTGQCQQQAEAYLSQHFGFREPVIRIYNQYLYDFYRKTYNEEVIPGRDHWFYYQQNVNDYYGTEMYRWQSSAEEARATYDRETRLMWKLREVLHDYGIEYLMFMAPEKGFLYPEHLPLRDFDTTTINAREYYSTKFDEIGFPYIEMTKWFQALKEADTLPYSLIPQAGAHWGFSSVLAADSLFRFMGSLKGEKLPALKMGTLRESSAVTKSGDRDLENTMNLLRRLSHKDDKLYDAEVTVVSDSTTTHPNVLFIGNSYLWRMSYYIPFEEVFSNSEYWFYNSTAFFGPHYSQSVSVTDLDLLQKLLESDYVVWFTTGNQMYKTSYGFTERALTRLCVSDDEVNSVRVRVMDSLASDSAFLASLKPSVLSNEVQLKAKLWQVSDQLVFNDPEYYFPCLAGDSVPTARNPRIPEIMIISDIKRDEAWMKVLRCQTVIKNTDIDNVLKMEVQNVLNNRPLMRDEPDVMTKEIYVESLVRSTIEELRNKPASVERIKEKAEKNGRTFEEQLEGDARWLVNDKIEKGIIQF